MSDVEALLSVDAGKVPPGTVAFFMRDPEVNRRRGMTVLAILMFGVATTGLIIGFPRVATALLALMGIGLAISAMPPERDPQEARSKKPTLVLTATGMILRDASGLRSWAFEDLKDVRPYLHGQRIGLLVIKSDGDRHFVDTLSFVRGERVRELIGRRLKPREV